MSYCRQSDDSDLYVIGNMGERGRRSGWTCFCGVRRIDSLRKLLRHLLAHRNRGDKVPGYAIDRVREELGRARRARR